MKLYSTSSVYEITTFISQGENSTVCMAYRKHKHYPIRQKIILKIFKPRSHTYPLELESLIRVRSNYCVRILHFELINNQPALILECIDGLNLLQLIQHLSSLTPGEISCICYQIQQGLIDLKKHGICHGDLSESNVLIDKYGNIKLIDFGKGNYMGKDVFSTPHFTAKEVLKGRRPDFLSDLFALGVLEKSLFSSFPLKKNLPPNQNQMNNPLLNPLPQKRKIKNFIFNKEDQQSLSKKVRFILDQKNISPVITQPIVRKRSEKRASFLNFIVICFLGITASGMNQKKPIGSITVRSHQWLYIKIENKKGFTPFSSGPLPSGKYTLYWKTHNGQNSQIITIQPGNHILLTDKDLLID